MRFAFVRPQKSSGRVVEKIVAAALIGSAVTLPGCTFFARKPALPKHAAIENPGGPAAPTDYSALVQSADVIYFPDDRAGSGAKSEPAELLLEAMEQTGKPFGIAWDVIDSQQQPLLDALPAKSDRAREESIEQLKLEGTGRAREYCRMVLREVRSPNARFLALRFPPALAAKIESGEINRDEQKLLPSGFNSPAGGFEAYAGRMATHSANDRTLVNSYRWQVLRQEFAAETIVRFFREAAPETRLLVFAPAADFEPGQGVPYYVAQKIRLRQLVLGPEVSPNRTKLLTRSNGNLRRGFEIVDRAPVAAGD